MPQSSFHTLFATALSCLTAAAPAAAGDVETNVPAQPGKPSAYPNDIDEVRERHLLAVNGERLAQGLVPLVPSPELDRLSQSHAEDMLTRDYFDHMTPEGDSVVERARQAGYGWKRLAENISRDVALPEETVEQWLQSPAHRANLLNPRVTEVGLGFAVGATAVGERRVIWVEVLALPRPRALNPRGPCPRPAASPSPHRRPAGSPEPSGPRDACARPLL